MIDKKINILILIIIIVIINYWYFFKLDKKLYINIKNNNKFNLIYNDKHPLNNFFDKVYVITLPKRKYHMVNLMKTNNIDIKIFDALTPENTPKEYLYENNYLSSDCILNDGKIYCHMSHISVLKDMIKNNYKNCFIFEDDIDSTDFNKENINYLDTILKNLPNDYEIFYLGKCWDIKDKNIIVNDYITKPYKPLCLHSYGVSNIGARKILDNILPLHNLPTDVMIAKLIKKKFLNSYSSYDQIFTQNSNEFGSNLNNELILIDKPPTYNNFILKIKYVLNLFFRFIISIYKKINIFN